MILASVVLSQYTRVTDRQTTYYDNSRTLQQWAKNETLLHCKHTDKGNRIQEKLNSTGINESSMVSENVAEITFLLKK